MATTQKRLHKSVTDKKLCGVCAGFAEYIDADPTLVRIIYFIMTLLFAGFPGIIIYFACALIFPNGDNSTTNPDAPSKIEDNNYQK